MSPRPLGRETSLRRGHIAARGRRAAAMPVLALVAGRIALHVELKGDPRVPARLVEGVLRLLEGSNH